MEEIVKHINDTNASYRQPSAGDAKNTDLFLDNEHYELFKDCGEQITVRYNKENLTKAILFIASILPRKFDQSATHELIRFSKEFVLDQLAIIDALFKEGDVSTNTFTQVWNARKDVPQKNGKIDKRFYFNGLLKDVEYVDHEGIHRNTKFTIRNYFAGGYSNLHISKSADGVFDVSIENTQEYLNDGKEDGLEEKYVAPIQSLALQQIFYGAPGTGKSHTIKECTEGKDVIRTTFHPDTDYSTFVGAYKPTTKAFPVTTVIGTKAVAVEDKDGNEMTADKIVYEFVPQAFLQAYVAAWQKFDKVEDLSQPKEEYLVIEEINRGNCAQIFGDLFQLLDRGDGSFSEYPIKADADMKKYLQKALKDTNLEGIKADLNGIFKGEDITKQVKEGDILLLPNNLYIWATMNTSDQSLFPIDSAFKRRWDWQYVPISDAKKNWSIKIGNKRYSWWSFLVEINKRIYDATYSEDKKLGYFFCKANNNIINADKFVGKVVFYLWNDVFKDTEFEGDAFKDSEGKLTFDKFYTVENGKTKVVNEKIDTFLTNLGLVPIIGEEDSDDEEEYLGQEESVTDIDEKKYWTDAQRKNYDYWAEFLNYAQNNEDFQKYFSGVKAPNKDNWKNFSIGEKSFFLTTLVQQGKHAVKVEVYIPDDMASYHKLLENKEAIENEMGTTYEWNEFPQYKCSTIEEKKSDIDFNSTESRIESFDFFIDRLLRMREVFPKYK